MQKQLNTRLIPVTAWNEFHPWPPVGGLRHLIFYASQNGFDSVVKKVGGRVLIDEAAFFAWANCAGKTKEADEQASSREAA
jgi:hypothetical protein